MSSPTEIFEAFLTPMKSIFARPAHSTEQTESAALAEYLDALKPYSKTVLETAWKDVRNSQTGRLWPTVAVCLKACRASREIETTHRKEIHPEAISGRIVDGEWQSWASCNCRRCRDNREAHHRQDAETFGRLSPWHR